MTVNHLMISRVAEYDTTNFNGGSILERDAKRLKTDSGVGT